MEIEIKNPESKIIIVEDSKPEQEKETINEETDTFNLIAEKIQLCVDELKIHENSEAIEQLTNYLINPDRIVELITEEDMFNLFIEKFRKTIK